LIETGDLVLALVNSIGPASGTGLEIKRHSALAWQIPKETLLALTFYRVEITARRAAGVELAQGQ
jgi:hypothetical protein